jgi:NAD+ diphosphatase
MAAYWLICKGNELLIDKGLAFLLPLETDVIPFRDRLRYIQNLGEFRGDNYSAAVYAGNETVSGRFAFQDLRRFFTKLDPELFTFLGRGVHLANWRCTHHHCGVCGAVTEEKADERALVCPECGQLYFPRISPAVITAVLRDDKILLARSKSVIVYKLFSLLAGFVEPGETLEECVAREVKEEVGIVVKNIRYFSSQPWPFPDSLMIGFTAEYASGEIVIDDKEIIEAHWFTRDALPNIPARVSIAGTMIDRFKQGDL